MTPAGEDPSELHFQDANTLFTTAEWKWTGLILSIKNMGLFLTGMLDMAPYRDAGHTMALQQPKKHTPLQHADMHFISELETLICPLKGSFELSWNVYKLLSYTFE